MNIMLVSVTERTREIGVLKALVASPRFILNVLLRETTLLAVAGSILGIAMAYGTRYVITDVIHGSLIQTIVYDWWPIAAAIAIVALAVESPEDQIRSVTSALSSDLRWAVTDPKTAQAFGDITSVPTMFLFDKSGKTAHVFYGAPPELHQQATKVLESLMN
jgi:hypothetical protein